MQKAIYKYPLNSENCPTLLTRQKGNPFEMEMIKDAVILHVHEQPEISKQGIPQTIGQVWAMVDPNETAKETRYFMLFETGERFDDTNLLRYIGTYQLYGGSIILHLFEFKKP